MARACISVSSGYEIPSLEYLAVPILVKENIQSLLFLIFHQQGNLIHWFKRSTKTNLHPRKPSMGFTSERFSILARASSGLAPVSAHNSLTMSSTFPSGRNSWSGGSRSRIVTEYPEMQKKNNVQ
jgi:hypothetical protein